jgi:excisionase family DNA binding protein
LKESAALLGCSPGKVRLLCLAGELPHFRVGVSYRVFATSITEYIALHTVTAPAPEQILPPSPCQSNPKSKPTGKRGRGPVVFKFLPHQKH